ncbi:DUF1294 domain-containing protein [Vibrio pelagius]|uniref:DUF1294 domain-containing protein n=1 Tax=Vibrio pelagius TaxID=28169 RepID=UPI00355905FF
MSSSLKIVFTYLFIVSLSIAFYSSSKLMFGGYLLIGLMTYFTYAKDKRAAIKGEWRVPENTLHLLWSEYSRVCVDINASWTVDIDSASRGAL